MAKKAYFIGNWKMNHGISETRSYFERFLPEISKVDLSQKVVAIAPPFTSLAFARKLTEGSPVKLCAQNACFAEKGAYTGEVSPLMLKELGVEYVILGHSERRHIFGETNELIKKRVKGVYQAGLTPILCVGETLEERKLGNTFLVVSEQLKQGLSELEKVEEGRLIIAYEPVWAIGTGVNATPDQAEEVHSFLRDLLVSMYSKDLAQTIPILYGGSVTPENIADLIKEPNVDGVLVGGASLDPEKFLKIVSVAI